MSIIIHNITEAHIPEGVNQYVVKINTREICRFEHDRTHDGLAQCLRDAADAVDAAGERKDENQLDFDQVAKYMMEIEARAIANS